jgi:hypothetical protein
MGWKAEYYARQEADLTREAKGHEWVRDDDGNIDVFAYSAGQFCNGPVCSKCGYGYCHHCHLDVPPKECSHA